MVSKVTDNQYGRLF